ncbi:MAG: nitronate monooxygenase [Planctomycetes bacterium]|nr:nitronate monooxygenase [Planctomycetota bacterium]
MLRTRLCELLDIQAPVLGAPMGPEIMGLELAAAVSNAGGLGIISFGGYLPPDLKERIRKLRTMTSRPFGVNILLEGPHLPVPEAAFVDVCIEERVPVLSFFWGDPTPYVEQAHSAGIKVCDQVGSVSAAKRARSAGVDFIIAQGVEAGGHVAGAVGTMVLVPVIVDAVGPIPVVAAGGIADGRGLAAALALGAEGVVLGTRLIASTECNAHDIYKQKIIAATEEDTVRTTLFGNGWPNAYHRTLRTPFVNQWLAEEKRGSEQRPDEPIVGEVTLGGMRMPLPRFGGIPPARDATGDIESMDFLAGQSAGLVSEIKPAAEIIREIVVQGESILTNRAATGAVA